MLIDFISVLTKILKNADDQTNLDALGKVMKSRTRNLEQCLEEERRASKVKPARMTPLFTGATQPANPAVNGTSAKITTNVKPSLAGKSSSSKGAFFQPFDHTFVLVEEGDLYCAPIHKQYPPSSSGRVTFPVLRFEPHSLHCPFTYFNRPRETNIYYSIMLSNEELSKKYLNSGPIEPHHSKHLKSSKHPVKRASFGGDPAKRPDFNPKSKPGYCECCYEKYEVLRIHILSEKHRVFAMNVENYVDVDDLISNFAKTHRFLQNPIVSWGNKIAAQSSTSALILSPAHSTYNSVYTKKSIGSTSMRALSVAVEDKENDSPSGLDLTGVDQLRLKRPIMSNSSDAFQLNQPDDKAKKKARRLGNSLDKIKL